MTNVYCANVTAPFPSSSDRLAIEIDAPANTTIKIKKIRISDDDGTSLLTSDVHKEIRLIRQSSAGTGGNTFTPINLDDNTTPSIATVKTGGAGFLPGTIRDTIDALSLHSVTDFYWSAADEDDKIVVLPGDSFGIILNPGNGA